MIHDKPIIERDVIFVHDGIKIPSRNIVLQAWVSSVVSRAVNLRKNFFLRGDFEMAP